MQPDQSLVPDDLVTKLRALADPTRLAIINLLMEGVQCNCEIAGTLDVSLSLISHHMRILREVGLIEAEKDSQDGRWTYYSVAVNTMRELQAKFSAFLDVARIQPRQPSCGPDNCDSCDSRE